MKALLVFGFLLCATLNGVLAQDNYSLSSQVTTIDGTSNLHNWHEKVEKISGKGEVKQGADKSLTIQSLSVVVQVNSIKGDGSTMDSKTYKALKADKFPEITFLLAEPVGNIPYGANSYIISAKGHLTIAGVTKPVVIAVKILLSEEKKITVQGIQEVKMSDYGLEPPTAMFGMLKTGNAITINFKTTFSMLN